MIFKISEYIRNQIGLEGYNFLDFRCMDVWGLLACGFDWGCRCMGEMMVSVTNFLGFRCMDVVVSGFDLGRCTRGVMVGLSLGYRRTRG